MKGRIWSLAAMAVLVVCSAIGAMLVFCPPTFAADEYVIAFGGTNADSALSVVETSDGGLVVAGVTMSYGVGEADILLTKFDASGSELWTRTLGGAGREYTDHVIETSDGGLVLSGQTTSYGAGGLDLLLSKFDNAGNHLWTRTLGGSGSDGGGEIVETSDGGLAVVGSTYSYGQGHADMLVAKFDASGTYLWAKTVGGTDYDSGGGLVEASDGGLVASGITMSYGVGERDHFVVKLDSSGNLLWARTLGDVYPYWGYGGNIVETGDGGLVITGSQNHWGGGTFDVVLAKFNASGAHLWTRTIGGSGSEWHGADVTEVADGGLVVTQWTPSFGVAGQDLLLAKFDSSGTYLWAWTLGGVGDDRGECVTQTSDNGLVVAGWTESFGAGSDDLLLSKHSASGYTCLGGNVSPTVTSPSPSITEPEPLQSTPAPQINSPDPTITSPSPATETVCRTGLPSTTVDWPMFHHDLLHTGYSTSDAPATDSLLWVYTTGDNVESSPAVADSNVYVGSWDNNVYCLDWIGNGDGTTDLIWSYTTGHIVKSSPAVADSNVYVGSYDGEVYCLDAEGNGDGTTDLIWSYTTGAQIASSPAVADSNVYVGSWDNNVYCLDAEGNGDGTTDLIWSYTTGGPVWSSPAVADSNVYVGSWDKKIYCLDAEGNGDGTTNLIWSYAIDDIVWSSPAVVGGRVYVGSDDYNVYCLDAEGNGDGTTDLIWSYTTGGFVQSSPAVADSNVYVGSYDSNVYCLDAEGNGDGTTDLIWSYTTGDLVFSSPAVADGKVYVGSWDSKVYCLDAEGNGDGTTDLIWSYTTGGGGVWSSPAVAYGTVHVGAYDGKIYAFRREGVPDPNNSYVEWRDLAPDGTSAFVCPCGGGSWLYVIVRDRFNAPLDSVVVTPQFSASCLWCQCGPVNAVTDSNGVAEFHIEAGLHTFSDKACCAFETTVECLGVTIPWKDTGGLETCANQWVSPEMTADGKVDTLDLVIFNSDYGGAGACRSDYDCDGYVGMADYVIFANHNGHECEPLVGVEGPPGGRPLARFLAQNYPNPFDATTHIAFSIDMPGRVVLRIYDVAGRRVRTLIDGPKEAKRYVVAWDGRTDKGKPAAAGVYFYRLELPGWSAVRKMTLAK